MQCWLRPYSTWSPAIRIPNKFRAMTRALFPSGNFLNHQNTHPRLLTPNKVKISRTARHRLLAIKRWHALKGWHTRSWWNDSQASACTQVHCKATRGDFKSSLSYVAVQAHLPLLSVSPTVSHGEQDGITATNIWNTPLISKDGAVNFCFTQVGFHASAHCILNHTRRSGKRK